MSPVPLTARRAGLVACETCRLVVRPLGADRAGHCPRCGTHLESRHVDSVERTWALLIAAAICYAQIFPLSLLPSTIT